MAIPRYAGYQLDSEKLLKQRLLQTECKHAVSNELSSMNLERFLGMNPQVSAMNFTKPVP